jgi:hypothetical protein
MGIETAAIIAGVAGAASSAASASAAGKKKGSYTDPTTGAPQYMASYKALTPELMSLQSQYAPQYAQQSGQIANSWLYGGGQGPGMLGVMSQAYKRQPELTAAWNRSNPETSGIWGSLLNQSRQEMQNPGQLSAADTRQITQATLSNPYLQSFGRSLHTAYQAQANIGQAYEQRKNSQSANALSLLNAYSAARPSLASMVPAAYGQAPQMPQYNPWAQQAQYIPADYSQANALGGMGGGLLSLSGGLAKGAMA